MPKLLTPRLYHDQPLDPGRLPEKPAFYFDDYANTFARLIADRETLTPLVLGLSGLWGSGKTTLLRQIQAKLDETGRRLEDARYSFLGEDNEGDFRHCRTVWFNAWKYADEDELLVALVRVIVQTMSSDDAVSKVLAQLLDPTYPRRDVVNTVLSWFALKTPLGEVNLNTGTPQATPLAEKTALLDLFSEAFDRLMAAWVHRSAEAKTINPAQGVMVVFIDDLDRCLPDQAVQVLEAIKLFLDRPGVVFVLAADDEAIRAAVEAHYHSQHIVGQRASDYLEKIFQVRFSLPPLSTDQANTYLRNGLKDVDEQLRQSLDLVLAGAEINPRQIKTFINYLNVGWAVLNNSGQARGVAQADFIRWLALTRVGPKFCEKVRDLPLDLRLDYIADATRWANDPTHKPGEYQDWTGADHRRLRNVLKVTAFSAAVTPDVLNGFIFWSAPEIATLTPTGLSPTGTPKPAAESAPAESKHPQGERGEALSEMGRTPGIARTADDNWITIPAGKFVMGSKEEDNQAFDGERPQHTLEIPYAYRIARYPVTNARFREFVLATQYKTTAEEKGTGWAYQEKESKWSDTQGANWQHPRGPGSAIKGLEEHPVVQISWEDARAYCDWLSGPLRQQGVLQANEIVRLPTEAEWEKAARGEYGKAYPWGDEWEPNRCNSAEAGLKTTTPVSRYASLGASPYGVVDMAGNVWEWTQSKYKEYPYQADDGREKIDESGDSRVLRGGSFNGNRRIARCAFRSDPHPDARGGYLGFRVVVVSPGSRS